jgi:hypothetical protein
MARENYNQGRDKKETSAKAATQHKKSSTNANRPPDIKSVKAEMEIRSRPGNKKNAR